MKYFSLLFLPVFCLAVAACSSLPPEVIANQSSEVVYSHRNGQLDLVLPSGNYTCDLGKNLKVERIYREKVNYRIDLGWNSKSYQLERDNSYSGLPRFKDRTGHLVWVDLPWKSLLLDGKTSKPLANDCRSPDSPVPPKT